MLAERRRVSRLLSDRSLAPLWVAWVVDRAGDWLVLLAILLAAGESRFDVSLAPWAFAIWLAPGFVLRVLYGGRVERLSLLGWAPVCAIKAVLTGLFLVAAVSDLIGLAELLLATAGVMGFASSLAADARDDKLRRAVGRSAAGLASPAAAFADRLGVFVGAAIAAVIYLSLAPGVAVLAAIAAFAVAAALAFLFARRSATVRTRSQAVVDAAAQDPAEMRAIARRIALHLVSAFTVGALGAVVILAALTFLVFLGDAQRVAIVEIGPALVAAGALGMLLGPLPVPRLLLRIPAPLVVLALSIVIAIAVVAMAATRSIPIALASMVAFGFCVTTIDSVRSIAVRRLVPPELFRRVTRLSLIALTVGQLYGLASIVSIGTSDPFAIAVVLAVAQVLLVALAIALGGRDALRIGGLSALSVKSVEHKLSWETSPDAVPADLSNAEPRAGRLGRWINRQVQLQRLSVTLPVSRREYTIYRPDEDSRERLFDAGRADPDKQMPYWAKVWPSGVALADVVVERSTEVAENHVLELGAGLGVTACAVLEYGGHLVTADYSALPLAHCRLNTLVNTGRAPMATCFNWRRDAEIAAATARGEIRDGFPLIIAGDVLYEGRDAEPLLNVIERLLTADGSLWLAEPVRRTAQRFLDSAATLGWDIESRQVHAEWPDATSGPVNVHFLRRSVEPDRIVADLGGWRI